MKIALNWLKGFLWKSPSKQCSVEVVFQISAFGNRLSYVHFILEIFELEVGSFNWRDDPAILVLGYIISYVDLI